MGCSRHNICDSVRKIEFDCAKVTWEKVVYFKNFWLIRSSSTYRCCYCSRLNMAPTRADARSRSVRGKGASNELSEKLSKDELLKRLKVCTIQQLFELHYNVISEYRAARFNVCGCVSGLGFPIAYNFNKQSKPIKLLNLLWS